MEQLQIDILITRRSSGGGQNSSVFTTGVPVKSAPNDESKENPLQPSPAEKVSPEMAEKLALLEKLGITLDDLENFSNPAEHKL